MTFELLNGSVTAPSTTLTALTMGGTDSLRVRHFDPGKKAYIAALWSNNQTAGELQVKSPKMHDAVQNIKVLAPATQPYPLLPLSMPVPIYSDDILDVSLSGSATAGDVETASILIAYEDMQASQGRYITAEEVKNKMINMLTIKCDLGSLSSAGYQGSQTIVADNDLLKSNTDYAILGAVCNQEVGAICLRGADTGNLRIGLPNDGVRLYEEGGFLMELSKATGWATIPVMNSENKNNTTVEVFKNENTIQPIIYFILAELGK